MPSAAGYRYNALPGGYAYPLPIRAERPGTAGLSICGGGAAAGGKISVSSSTYALSSSKRVGYGIVPSSSEWSAGTPDQRALEPYGCRSAGARTGIWRGSRCCTDTRTEGDRR